MPYRMRTPQQVADEFLADGQPYAVFVDNNLGSRPDYLQHSARRFGRLSKIWSAAVTIDVTDDPSLVREHGAGGLHGRVHRLRVAHGRQPRRGAQEDAEDRRLRAAGRGCCTTYGIQVNGCFVLGFDHDRKDVFERTAEWIEENRLECATFHILTPYPGTPLFRQMESEGRLLHRDWSRTTRRTPSSARST